MMNNANAQQAIDDCTDELQKIKSHINQLGSTSSINSFLTRYSLIKICGTLEICYKTIIADYYEKSAPHLGQFICHHLRDASMNANYNNICTAVERFDSKKADQFKAQVNLLSNRDKAIRSLSELNRERNNFAHGLPTSISFIDLNDKFNESICILNELDMVMT